MKLDKRCWTCGWLGKKSIIPGSTPCLWKGKYPDWLQPGSSSNHRQSRWGKDCPCWKSKKENNELTFDELMVALEESVILQSHYAKLLNQYDGGERISFLSPEAWITRLRECSQK